MNPLIWVRIWNEKVKQPVQGGKGRSELDEALRFLHSTLGFTLGTMTTNAAAIHKVLIHEFQSNQVLLIAPCDLQVIESMFKDSQLMQTLM